MGALPIAARQWEGFIARRFLLSLPRPLLNEEENMDALLGKITTIARSSETPESASGPVSLEVKFKAACLLPQRTKVPEWLKDQTLTLKREVPDPREAGEPGDTVLLSPVESERWLAPLTVTPTAAYGKLPDTLQIRLRWWKEEKLPEFTVHSNGRSQTGQFTKQGEEGVASIETAPFWGFEPTLPVMFEVTVDKMKAACTVLPEREPYARKLLLADGERYRMENGWYLVEVSGRTNGGAIVSLQEKGRGVDHFREPQNLIQTTAEHGGHIDRLFIGWGGGQDKMSETAVSSAGIRREGGATRLQLDGTIDEGQNLRTSVVYTLYDHLPLLLLERSFQLGKGKEPDKDKKDEKPKEPIDDMRPFRFDIRPSWKVERQGRWGSRILNAEGNRLSVTRPGQVGEHIGSGRGWKLTDGWAIIEHPGRREHTLYLFDAQAPPKPSTFMGERSITFEPNWPHVPVRPEEAAGFTLALTAGEICGAGKEGGWVASRTPLPEGGVRCAIIGRLRDAVTPATATITLGGETRSVPLQAMLLPGVGGAVFATATFGEGQMDQPFDVNVDQIARRQSL
jgi:hypothetical protein